MKVKKKITEKKQHSSVFLSLYPIQFNAATKQIIYWANWKLDVNIQLILTN